MIMLRPFDRFILGYLFIFSIIFFGGGIYIETSMSIPNQECRKSILLKKRYLISSELNYGRLSNLKISIAEVIGLSIALNRTAVLPKLDSCILSSEDLGWSGVTEFDQLFDASSFSRASIVSSSGFDLNRVCGQDTVTIIVSDHFVKPKSIIRGEKTINLADIELTEPLFFGQDVPLREVFSSYPYDNYFLQKVTELWASKYMTDRLLPDKLATLDKYKCIVLGRNFLSLNWARLPKEFEEVHRELVASPAIRADVVDFLSKKNLIRHFSPLSSSYVVPYIAIHLRMGDFLTLDSHRGFGFDCNNHPEMLITHVRDILQRFSENAPILLATDDYNSNCATYLRKELTVISLDEASRFYSKSCQGALFDQEVLGASSFFIGDKKSTFSLSIHQIRTLRYLHDLSTTIWL